MVPVVVMVAPVLNVMPVPEVSVVTLPPPLVLRQFPPVMQMSVVAFRLVALRFPS